MSKFNFQGKTYSLKVLKGLVTQGIRLTVSNDKLKSVDNAPVIESDVLVVTPSGEDYLILLGKINPDKKEQPVRMLSKMVLKKALWELVNPPPVAARTYNDTTPQYHNQRSYRPRNNYGDGDFSGGY